MAAERRTSGSRPVCALCQDSMKVTYGPTTVECPLHDGSALVEPSAESTEGIRQAVMAEVAQQPDRTPTTGRLSSDPEAPAWRVIGFIAIVVVGLIGMILLLVTLGVLPW